MFRLYSRSLTQGNAAVTADYTTQRSPRAGAPDSPQDPGLPFPACCFPRSRLPPSRGALHRPLHVLPPAHPARGKSPLGQKLQVSWLPMSALSRSWVSGVQRGSRLPAEKQCIRWGPPNQAARVYAWTRITFRGTPSSQVSGRHWSEHGMEGRRQNPPSRPHGPASTFSASVSPAVKATWKAWLLGRVTSEHEVRWALKASSTCSHSHCERR